MASSTRKRAKQQEPADLIPSQANSLVFISHDSRDAELAEAFSKLLSSVSAGVLKSFRSSDRKGSQGIEYGTEWYPELMKNLSAASDVVCLLTQSSIERPWILYEAGVAKGRLNTAVYGIALGITLSRAASGPFAQFQNSDDSEESLTKLVMQLVGRIPNSEPDRDAIAMQVRTFNEKAKTVLDKLDARVDEEDQPSVDDTSVARLFEEVKVMFQDLPSRIEGRLDPMRHKRHRRFHPMMLEEFLHFSKNLDDPTWLLLIISLFRDELPWLYEVGLEAYRAIKDGDPATIEKAVRSFRTTVDFARHAPFMEGFQDKDTHFMVMELPNILEKYILRTGHEGDLAESLTSRQREILQMIAEGKTTKQIAVILGISVKTVETHRQQLMDRLGVHNTADLLSYALKTGLIKSLSLR
jgi:DNA-binding CsgD family transcriptional regulator